MEPRKTPFCIFSLATDIFSSCCAVNKGKENASNVVSSLRTLQFFFRNVDGIVKIIEIERNIGFQKISDL